MSEPKFKVGDTVRMSRSRKFYALKDDVDVKVRELIGNNDVLVTAPTGYPTKYIIDNFKYPVNIFKLVTPEIPLFRKGDKILVEYTVLEDEQPCPNRMGSNSHVKVTAPGVQAAGGVTRQARLLLEGSITRAPEPPYVPKPGDKFNFGHIEDPRHLNTCLWADEKGVLYESQVGYRAWHNIGPYFKRS